MMNAIPGQRVYAALGLALMVSMAAGWNAGSAQQAPLTLEAATRQAIERGPDIASSRATLDNARADLKAKEADPSTLIVQMTQARNTAELNRVQFEAKKIEIAQSVTTAFTNLYEAQENLKVLQAQVDLDSRSLEIAKARLAARNGTQLDVNRAEGSLSSSRQSLADARANLPILSNRLEVLLGTNVSGNLSVAAPPAFRERKIDLPALESGLGTRLPNVLQAAQTVALNELNVRLSDNDYTAPATLRDARTNLENSRRNLDTVRSNAMTGLRDSARSVANSLERVRIAAKNFDNAADALEQDQTKFKSGTISRYQLQQTEVSTLSSRYSLLQASNAYQRALAALSVAGGVDVTGLVPVANEAN